VLVSEVMSQQTGIDRVVPKWTEFMERFPTVDDCAAADLGDVLAVWQGLGYPRRARDLHRAAGAVVAAGGFPTDLEGWMALPGVGPYTARAVMAFSQSAVVAVVDTNVARVLSRWSGRSFTARAVQERADELVPLGDAWSWNQSLMELGAVVCRARSPRCPECPVVAECSWQGSADRDDPALTTAGTSRPQARFAGSDRQARGRLLRRLVAGAVASDAVPGIIDRSAGDAERIVASLVADGLCVIDGTSVRLPGESSRRAL
jgi:A/G-specific adenine glycosylase